MEPRLKACLKAIVLELRRELEGHYDAQGNWHPGDLERRLAAIGVRRDRAPVALDELPHLPPEDREARRVVDAFLKSRTEAGIDCAGAMTEFVRQAAYTWTNRLMALRCMEARGLIDDVILQKAVYGGRSLQHHRLARKAPERCAGEDEGLFATLFEEFERRASELPLLFNPRAPEVTLRPSVATIKRCAGLLSGTVATKGQKPATDEVFTAPDALGWAYQYWNTEEKDRVFEKVRTKKGAKIEGAEIIPATCIYTEPYIVKFLVQNSLGALWMGMQSRSRLAEGWEYYVRDADRAPVEKKLLRGVTFLDPACGSGHFLIEAFDLFYAMYQEEGQITEPAEICAAILEWNLYGIDIDERAVQIAAMALVMKAKEKAPTFVPRRVNLVATNIRLPAGKDHLEAFLRKHPDDAELKPALLAIFDGLGHADELGSLLQIEEPVERELRHIRQKLGRQLTLTGPKTEEEWVAWKAGTIERLRQHFDIEAQAPDLIAALFGEAGAKGLSLVDVLARRYDIVAANPPYMGSKNMGPILKNHIKRHFEAGRRDLYAAFILRCVELITHSGRVAMVTQQSWMFNKYFQKLRSGTQTGILGVTRIECLAHIGPNGFEELSGEVVSAAATVLAMRPDHRHHALVFRLTDLVGPHAKSRALIDALRSGTSTRRFRVTQSEVARLPGAPLVYWLKESLLHLIHGLRRLSSIATVCEGLHPTDTPRFVRYYWEIPWDERWIWYSRGGEFRRWIGIQRTKIDWGQSGERLRLTGKAIIPSAERYLKAGLTYTDFASGTMAARYLDVGQIFSDAAPAIFPEKVTAQALLAIVNSRFFTLVMRALSPSPFHFRTGYVAMAPVPNVALPRWLDTVVAGSIQLARVQVSRDATEAGYAHTPLGMATSLHAGYRSATDQAEAAAAIHHGSVGIAEREVAAAYGLHGDDLAAVLAETGTPAGWHSLIAGYDALPPPPDGLEMPADLLDRIHSEQRRPPSPDQVGNLKRRLRELYEAGPGAKSEEGQAEGESDEEDDDELAISDVRAHIPAETFVEELAEKLEVHPISVYWLLRELREKDGVLCGPELRRFAEDHMSVMVLRLLGHRWPREVESREAAPAWADSDEIVPTSEGTRETSLLARVRARVAEDFGSDRANAIEREFAAIVGKPIEQWLASDFFARHISQFKNRPIAWQVQSRRAGTAKRSRRGRGGDQPAFSCLVYYQRLDADLLAKLRTQYVGPLRTRLQTELAGLETLDNRTTDQDARRLQLEAQLEELKDFDSLLETVITGGFACSTLDVVGAKETLDKWTSRDGQSPHPTTRDAFLAQERRYDPDINDGVRVNVAPLQKAGLLAADVLAPKDVDKAIANRAEWRADERRWCREGKLPRPGWWPQDEQELSCVSRAPSRATTEREER